MSNEELVALIKDGAVERIPELWEQMEKLVIWKANRVLFAMEMRGNMCGVEQEDLIHAGFPALVAAIETFDTSSGAKFSTWFMFYLKTAFYEATGSRTKRGLNDPVNSALSLDSPLSDDSDSGEFYDIVSDPEATSNMQTVDEKLWYEQLQEAVRVAMAALPDAQRETLQLRYYQGMTLKEIAEMQGISFERVRQKENEALRMLRKPKHASRLVDFYEFDYYHSSSLEAFRYNQASIQERFLIVQEERKQKAAERAVMYGG